MKYKIRLITFFFLVLAFSNGKSQTDKDTIAVGQQWNIHFQNTEIFQYHPGFHADYSGKNSLNPNSESTISSTSTLFLGFRPWKYGAFYFNPEVSAGKGFSRTLGVAGFPNGEVYRVSDPKPQFTPARFYFRQIFSLSENYKSVEDGLNQLAEKIPESYFAINAGKFSIMDFFDDNQYSHNPRTQFYNWALMGNGAWDYPADTKGYTFGSIFELVKPKWAIRFSAVMVPTQANGPVFDGNIRHANSEALEFERKISLNGLAGFIHLLGYYTQAKMGSYQKALDWGITHNTSPDIDIVQKVGNTKYGFGFSLAQQISKNTGVFFRAGWNDGHNETWVFTEIDKAISGGFNFNGQLWQRDEDEIGIAFIANGLSDWHKKYLAAGGYGFIIGDGHLNYGTETIAEVYYLFRLKTFMLSISPDYQIIINPAYNKDRGPVNVFGLRAHFEF
jgi:high affinity Mn2+ porin